MLRGLELRGRRTSTSTVPVGLHVDTTHFGVSGTYRFQQNTARNAGGHGGRLAMRASGGDVHASAFADIQQEAATIDLVLREEPALAQALTELGLTATSADDLARLLRENATLAQLGGDLSWIRRDKTQQQLRLRVLLDRTQTVTARQQTASVALAYQRRLRRNIDVNGMVSWWARDAGGAPRCVVVRCRHARAVRRGAAPAALGPS